jgi:hypothetical protein
VNIFCRSPPRAVIVFLCLWIFFANFCRNRSSLTESQVVPSWCDFLIFNCGNVRKSRAGAFLRLFRIKSSGLSRNNRLEALEIISLSSSTPNQVNKLENEFVPIVFTLNVHSYVSPTRSTKNVMLVTFECLFKNSRPRSD